ncbi:MAG: FGGY-family carbohydrate kinase [Armatimonadota bacterium]
MPASGPYVLGIDCGTQSLRAVVVGVDGRVAGSAAREYPVQYPQVAWAEQDAQDWWQAARAAVPAALSEAGISKDDIAGISVDGTSCTVVVTTREGQPLRPVILWMDQRAHEEAQRITDTEHPRLKYVSYSESPEWMIPKAMWVAKHEPEVFDEADLVIEGTDWLMFRLTGNWAASQNNATCKWNYASVDGGWPEDLLDTINFPELMDKWPSTVLAMGEQAGELTGEAASALGLKPGTPVAQGGIDAYAAMLGLEVVEPGRTALVMGTSTCPLTLSAEAIYESHLWGPYPEALVPDTWALEGGQTTTGAIVNWLAENFAHREAQQAEEEGRNIFEVLDEKAAGIPPGAEGLVLLDYFQGNRTPLRDPLARGAIWGLSLRHNIGHLLRAVYEGTAMGCRHIFKDMSQAGLEVEEVYACGGGTRSDLWLQIHANVCKKPIFLTQEPEATALGTAVCAAAGAGLFDDVTEASREMVTVTRQIDPDPDTFDTYDALFDRYLQTYPALADLMHESAREQ